MAVKGISDMAKKADNQSAVTYAGTSSLAFDYLEAVVAREMELTYRVFGVQTQSDKEQARPKRSGTEVKAKKKAIPA